jgi:hypothetical protein
VQDIVLRHVADDRPVRVVTGVEIVAVDQDRATGRALEAAQRHHQRRLARAARTDDRDELAGLDRQRGGVEQHPPRYFTLDAARVDPNRAALVERVEAVAVVRQPERTDLHDVARRERARAMDAYAVDPGAVLRAEVAQHVMIMLPAELRVPPRDERLLEHDVAAGAPDRHRLRAGRRREVMNRCDARRERIAIHERDEVAVRRIGQPHQVAVVQHGILDGGAAEQHRTVDSDHVVCARDQIEPRVCRCYPRCTEYDIGCRRASDRDAAIT